MSTSPIHPPQSSPRPHVGMQGTAMYGGVRYHEGTGIASAASVPCETPFYLYILYIPTEMQEYKGIPHVGRHVRFRCPTSRRPRPGRTDPAHRPRRPISLRAPENSGTEHPPSSCTMMRRVDGPETSGLLLSEPRYSRTLRHFPVTGKSIRRSRTCRARRPAPIRSYRARGWGKKHRTTHNDHPSQSVWGAGMLVQIFGICLETTP